MKNISWFDMLVYKLFYWRWNKLLASRPDLRELFITWLKVYDVVDTNQEVEVSVSITIPKRS